LTVKPARLLCIMMMTMVQDHHCLLHWVLITDARGDMVMVKNRLGAKHQQMHWLEQPSGPGP
jgi:hypothetical protein